MSQWDDERVTPQMLSIVDPDPAEAVVRYRRLLADLTRSLEYHGCRDADDVASESVYRGLKRLAGGADTAKAGLRAYIFGIAKNVARERQRKSRELTLTEEEWAVHSSQTKEHAEVEARLMLTLLDDLAAVDRTMLVRYYSEDDDDEHKAHAKELGIKVGNLRVKVHRLKKRLQEKLADRERAARERLEREMLPESKAGD
jgi:RNA polymerase sigma factor (sigma-70 family)